MDCEETLQRLYHFLDGELTTSRREEIARHLDHCGPCVDVFGFEAELRAVIASRCKERVPEHLRVRIAAAISWEQKAGEAGGAGGQAGQAG